MAEDGRGQLWNTKHTRNIQAAINRADSCGPTATDKVSEMSLPTGGGAAERCVGERTRTEGTQEALGDQEREGVQEGSDIVVIL